MASAARLALGASASLPYKLLFLVCLLGVVFGSGRSSTSRTSILGMAFPNILGLFILSNSVKSSMTTGAGSSLGR